MGKGHRQQRLGEEIRKIISSLLLRELKDPRLQRGMVSVTAVEVTSDGSYATVYITVLGLDTKKEDGQKIKEDTLAALNSAKGLIRREIGHQVKLRHTPELIFKMDTSMEYGRHMEEILQGLDL
ncbi:30S ribosome-binding factor RbfA [bacterium 210820-DFI.6.37]|nr:30S ribosome-binding factor RbfA [bacterium 210820-DFI.6.37]